MHRRLHWKLSVPEEEDAEDSNTGHGGEDDEDRSSSLGKYDAETGELQDDNQVSPNEAVREEDSRNGGVRKLVLGWCCFVVVLMVLFDECSS